MTGTAASAFKYRRVQVITKYGIVAASDDHASFIELIDKDTNEILHKYTTLLKPAICGAGDNMMNSMCELKNFVYVVSSEKSLVRLQLEKPYEEVEVKKDVEDVCALGKDVFVISRYGLLSSLFSQGTASLESQYAYGTENFGVIKGYKNLLFVTSYVSSDQITNLRMLRSRDLKQIDICKITSEGKLLSNSFTYQDNGDLRAPWPVRYFVANQPPEILAPRTVQREEARTLVEGREDRGLRYAILRVEYQFDGGAYWRVSERSC